MRVEIEGTDPPGTTFSSSRNVHVGLQRKRGRTVVPEDGVVLDGHGNAVEQVHPGDRDAAFTCEVEVVDRDDGVDFRGPHVQGSRGDRFLYLSWFEVLPDGHAQMFRRAKLMLDRVDVRTIAAARSSGTLHATVRLTGGDGGPVCAAVKPGAVTWSSR